MDGPAILEQVRADAETELSRLGSEKALLAATQASIDAPSVLGVLAASLDTASARLDAWAEATEEADLAAALADGAERLGSLRATLADPSTESVPAPTWLGDRLADPETDAARAAAGLVGVPLVLDTLCLQAVGFFVNEAATAQADDVRAVREEIATLRDESAETIAENAAGADEAVAGAVAVIEAAYAEYADRLDEMGFDPKPIC